MVCWLPEVTGEPAQCKSVIIRRATRPLSPRKRRGMPRVRWLRFGLHHPLP